MWGWSPETAERLRIKQASQDPAVTAEAIAKREAEKLVNEAGIGECSYCHEEIEKNERESWESAFLLEYCTEAKDHRHKPKIVWKVAE